MQIRGGTGTVKRCSRGTGPRTVPNTYITLQVQYRLGTVPCKYNTVVLYRTGTETVHALYKTGTAGGPSSQWVLQIEKKYKCSVEHFPAHT